MGLWIKNADGTIERTAGGGGTFDGDHVLTGDPLDPPADLAAGQLLWDGVEGGGDSGGGLTWPLLAPDGTEDAPSYSFNTNGASGTYLAADGSVRIAAEGTDTIGFDSRYITLGGQQQGVGRLSILAGSSGSPVYGFEGDIGTGIYRADSGVLGVSTGGVERLRVGASSTFKGGLQVDGQIKGPQGTQTEPTFTSVNDPTSGFYAGNFNAQPSAAISVGGIWRVSVVESKTTITNDLQVDGNADLIINAPADAFGRTTSGTVFTQQGLVAGTQGSFGTAMTSNGYRNNSGEWTSLGLNNSVGAASMELLPTGKFYVRASSNWPTGSGHAAPVRFTVNESGPTFRAMPSKTRTVDDVLERAETAEYPPEDDEGVATMDGHDEVPLFEVVSALLAKVKELSAEIEELKGA